MQNGDEMGIDCGGSCPNECDTMSPAAIPTMSEWGLILLTLLTLTFVTLSVTSAQTRFSGFNGGITLDNLTQWNNYPFHKATFTKALLAVGGLALLAATGTLMVYGAITMTDFVGTMIAGPVLAYLIHLLILVNQSEK